MKVKNAKKPHECTTCNSEFVSKGDLNWHIDIVQEGETLTRLMKRNPQRARILIKIENL